MFEVSVEETFAAAHNLRDYHGKCENLHGHNYRVLVTVEGKTLDGTGLLVDFVELKRAISEVVARLDHRYLNELPPFDVLNPSAENIARYFFEQISGSLGTERKVAVREVKIWETQSASATYRL
ncbi:MAG: 6-carboxytetrahydropterin synthase QueD [Bryobacteraceae bacterium]